MQKKDGVLHVGLAGLGGIAKRTHLPVLRFVPGYEVVCGAEKNETQRKRVAGIFKLKETYDDFKEMIEKADIDAVFICLPATLHMQAARLALQRGLHVFCEKPMGVNYEEALEMTSLAEMKKKILMPGYNVRYVDNFIRAKRFIDSGKLGRILQINAIYLNPGPYISWDPKTDWYLEAASKGALYDIGSHLVDLLFHLYPHRIKKLKGFAAMGYRPYDAITNFTSAYEGEDGILGAVQIGWRTASEVCSLEFHGTAGSLMVNRRTFTYVNGATDPADRFLTSVKNAFSEVRAVVGKLNRIRKGAGVLEEFVCQAEDFRDAVLSGTVDLTKAKEAVYVHEVLNAMLTSVTERGGMVSPDELKPSFRVL